MSLEALTQIYDNLHKMQVKLVVPIISISLHFNAMDDKLLYSQGAGFFTT